MDAQERSRHRSRMIRLDGKANEWMNRKVPKLIKVVVQTTDLIGQVEEERGAGVVRANGKNWLDGEANEWMIRKVPKLIRVRTW